MSFISRGVFLCRFTGYAAVFTACLIAPILRADSDPFQGPIGPHHRVWTGNPEDGSRANLVANPSGVSRQPQSAHRVVEIGTGMNFWDGQQWTPSVPEFKIVKNAFVADQVQHPVKILKNLKQQCSVTTRSPDGITLQSTPSGIALYDAVSGRTKVIGVIKDCTGVLVSSNRVWFENAFDGVSADVIFTIERHSFEQDIVITGHLDPADWDFPTNSTRIEIFSEFFDGHQPDHMIRPMRIEQDEAIRAQMAAPDLVDDVLGFGELTFVTGRAFTAANELNTNGVEAVVVKEFRTFEEGKRTFMIESVEYGAIKEGLDTLPERERHASRGSVPSEKRQYASIPPPVPAQEPQTATIPPSEAPIQMAKVAKARLPGLVIDYVATLTSISTPYTLQGDTTYKVVSQVYINGPLTIEGGVVVKYQPNMSITLNNTLSCKTSSYRPAIFTAVDDHTAGEQVSTGSIGSNRYANPALQMPYPSIPPVLSNLRFCYAQEAIRIQGFSVNETIHHSQFVNCIRGVNLIFSGSGCTGAGITVTMNNCLMDKVQYPLNAATICGTYYYSANLYHCTFGQSIYLAVGPSYSDHFSIIAFNSIFSQIPTLASGYVYCYGDHNGFFNTPGFGNNRIPSNISPPFQPRAFGNYYLANSVNFRNAGMTTGIPISLLNDLKQRTVDPPDLVTGSIITHTTWNPGARDTDVPDLGYHYDALDYVLNNVSLSAILNLANGVAVGLQNVSGLDLQNGARINSEGTPIRMNHLVSLANVQEQPTITGNPSLMTLNAGGASTCLDFRFTEFSIGQGKLSTLLNVGSNPFEHLMVRDCWIHDTTLNYYPSSALPVTVAFINNILDRCQITLGQIHATQKVLFPVLFYNNLFLGDPNSSSPGNPPALALYYDIDHYTSPWELHDNIFDHASQSMLPNNPYPVGVHSSTNEFTTGTSINPGFANVNDPTSITIAYQAGPLGNFYLPTSANQLINHGSRPASLAGLCCYTTRVDQGLESDSLVDIGFHYVGLDGNNLPIDSDSDGLPDYCKDRINPYLTGNQYEGANEDDTRDGGTSYNTPDTMGSVGPNHFMEVINGCVIIFDRSGQRLARTTLKDFFGFTDENGVTHPRFYESTGYDQINDPRIIYDPKCDGHWYACAKERNYGKGNDFILAVSVDNDPVGDPNLDWKNIKWRRYLVPVSQLPVPEPDYFNDFPVLGIDDNGIYITANYRSINGPEITGKIVAIPKLALLQGQFPTVPYVFNCSMNSDVIQAVHNYDTIGSDGNAWFVATSKNQDHGVLITRLSWSEGVPSLVQPWTTIETPDYSYGGGIFAKQPGPDIDPGGPHLENAVIRSGMLWTCRTVMVNSQGGAANPDRTCCEWIKINVAGVNPVRDDFGRIYDNAAINQHFYFMPSIMVNSRNDVIIGCSGSSASEYVGCYYAGRLGSDPLGFMSSPLLFKSGEDVYNAGRWGDYSHCSLDPNNDLSMWAIQEYSKDRGERNRRWGTWVIELIPFRH